MAFAVALAGNEIGRSIRLRAGTVRGVERWTFYRHEARNSRPTVRLAGTVHKTEYDFAHMKLPASLLKHVEFHFYHSGHMLYVHPATLVHLDRNLMSFYHFVLAHR